MEKTLRAALVARAILRYGEEILAAPGMHTERLLMQHGKTSVYEHCIAVTFMGLYLAKRWRLRVDERALVRGALLHDYFLYDWHKPGHGHLHGFRHPKIALCNAQREFALSDAEKDVILRHMFPLNPLPPGSKEGWLVCTADKVCAICETLRVRTMSERLMDAIEKNLAR